MFKLNKKIKKTMIKKIILPILVLSIALFSCADPSAGSVVPDFFTDVKEVSIGYNGGGSHAAAVKEDGSLWTWGSNGFGELGIGTSGLGADKTTPVQISGSWKSVSAAPKVVYSGGHVAAIKDDGSLWSWGLNGSGQLGDNSTFDSPIPVPVGNATWQWRAVSAGGEHTVAIRKSNDPGEDDTLWAWGKNNDGQLGITGTAERLIPENVVNATIQQEWKWKAVSAGRAHTFAIRKSSDPGEDGTLWGWGDNYYGQLGTTGGEVIIGGGRVTWKAVSAGSYHTAAIKSDGTLWTWGSNSEGQIGNGTTGGNSSHFQIGSDKWKAVSAGKSHTAAIKEDGTLWAWGRNNEGQLGDGERGANANKNAPVYIGSNFKTVSAGYYHTIAIKIDGVMWAWGYSYNGILGYEAEGYRTVPKRFVVSP